MSKLGASGKGIGALDANGDGRINASDLLIGFDASGDGNLDSEELQKIADQLSSQLEYNNTLLDQMQQLEELQLESQKELSISQNTCKKHALALEEAKKELADTKKKLHLAQDIADTVSKQAKDSRLESANHKSEAEAALKALHDTKFLLKESTDERARLQQALTNAQANLGQIRGDAEHVIRQLKDQNEGLKQSVQSLTNDLNDFRGKVAPLESEKETLKEKIGELVKNLEETLKVKDEEALNRSIAEKKIRDMSNTIDALCSKQNDVQGNYNELKMDNESLKHRVDMCEDRNNELEEIEAELRNEISVKQDEIQYLNELNMSLEQDIEDLRGELENSAKAKSADNQKWVEKLNALQKESQLTIDQTKAHAEDFAMNAQKHATDAINDRKAAENKCAALSKECTELHTFIHELQETQSQNQQAWEEERASLESTVMNYEQQCYAADDAVQKAISLHQKEKSELLNTIKAYKEELISRGEQFVNSTTIIQLAVRKYRDEALVNRERTRDMANQLLQISKLCATLKDRFNGPLTVYRPEVEAVLKVLHSKCSDSKKLLDEAKDKVRKLNLGKEEEKSKTIALEEIVSRLEHENKTAASKIAMIQQQGEERTAQLKDRIQQLNREKEDMEERLKRQQASLESVLAQSRAVQVANQNMQSSLNTSSTKFAATKQEYESRINQLSVEIRHSQEETASLTSQNEANKTQMKKLSEEVNYWKKQVTSIENNLNRAEKEKEAILQKRANSANASNDTINQYQVQLKQTQDILKVVQAQRAELQKQNHILRAELESNSASN